MAMRELYGVARIVGLDVGERRIGVAISDATCTLARPAGTLQTTGLDGNALDVAAAEITRLAGEDDGLASIVVGLPRHLDGSPNAMTRRIERFGARLRARIELPVIFQDERLTSREAEGLLAAREKDWRVRKRRLDAAAAALLLQDYLESHPVLRPVIIGDDPDFP
jgi:putative Holliday junction resolvase